MKRKKLTFDPSKRVQYGQYVPDEYLATGHYYISKDPNRNYDAMIQARIRLGIVGQTFDQMAQDTDNYALLEGKAIDIYQSRLTEKREKTPAAVREKERNTDKEKGEALSKSMLVPNWREKLNAPSNPDDLPFWMDPNYKEVTPQIKVGCRPWSVADFVDPSEGNEDV
jgi:hypothetical protein